MNKELSSLEQEREQLYKQLQETGDFRQQFSLWKIPAEIICWTKARHFATTAWERYQQPSGTANGRLISAAQNRPDLQCVD